MGKVKNPLQVMVRFAMKNKIYPKSVRKFLSGLYATLFLTHVASVNDMEKLVYMAYRNGYILGAAEYGGDGQKIQDSLPDLGIDESFAKEKLQHID